MERCRRCSAETSDADRLCPPCRDVGLCPPDQEERIWKRLGLLNLASLMFVIVGLGLMIQVVPFFGRALRVPLWGSTTLDHAIPPFGAFVFALGLGFGALCKGRSVLWGFLGLLCFPGFIVLHFMDKICPHCRLRGSYRDRRCFRCGAPI